LRQYELETGVEGDKFVGPGADRRLLEALVTNLLDVFLRYDPSRASGARVKRQKIRPRPLELETDMARIGDFHLRHPLHHQIVGGAAIAFERELDVFGRHRVAIVEQRALAQGKLVAETVFGGGPGLGKARRD